MTRRACRSRVLPRARVGGVHCVGMCGGIVAAFSSKNVSSKYVVRGPGDRPAGVSVPSLILFNTGRVTSYTLAGAVAGALGSAGALAAHLVDLQVAFYVIANVMLVMIGLHLAGVSPLLARLEKVGTPVWRRIQPLAVRFLPADTPVKALIAGSLWGWLPCGLVYGMLATSVASGTVAGGALTMLAFGLGTVPNLMLAGVALAQLRRFIARKGVRLAVGGLVISFGLAGLARSAALGEMVRRGLDCSANANTANLGINPATGAGFGAQYCHPHMIANVSLSSEELTLPGGEVVCIRPIRPEDSTIEQAFVRALSADSRYNRFMGQVNELSHALLDRFTHNDYPSTFALVATVGEGRNEKEIAVARYCSKQGDKACEFAVTVADEWHGRGVGSLLIGRLMDLARKGGLERMEGYVLSTNQRMLGFARFHGFRNSQALRDRR